MAQNGSTASEWLHGTRIDPCSRMNPCPPEFEFETLILKELCNG
jgi:hypothetical protein